MREQFTGRGHGREYGPWIRVVYIPSFCSVASLSHDLHAAVRRAGFVSERLILVNVTLRNSANNNCKILFCSQLCCSRFLVVQHHLGGLLEASRLQNFSACVPNVLVFLFLCLGLMFIVLRPNIFIMAAVRSKCTLYFCPVVSSIFYLLFSSPNLSGRRVDVNHTSTHGVAPP